MSLLKRQGFFNSIILYIGIGVGFFNSIILFQRFLTLEEIGFFYLLISISVFYSQVTSLGLPNVITRYLPFFRSADRTHKGFPGFVFLVCFISFIVVTIGFLISKEITISLNSAKRGSSLLSRYYLYIIPVAFFTLAFLLLETFARANYKNIFPAFLREVLLRIFTSIGVILIAIESIDFTGFIHIYVLSNLLILLILCYYNYRLQSFKLSPITPEVKAEGMNMMHYGLLSMLSAGSLILLSQIGLFSLKMINGEAFVGIYGTFFIIAGVISLPAKALNTTSYQIIADAWKNEDLKKINTIYFKTSVVQLLIGSLILVGLIINQKNILYLLHKPEFGNYFGAFIIIGIGFLVDITGGLNGAIIGFSKDYKFQTRILIVNAIICVVLSISLITYFGLIGAAYSYTLTMFFLNFSYWLYLKLRFNLQPFGKKHILVLLIGIFSLVIGRYIPHLTNYYFDVILRSGITTIIYSFLAYRLNISEDINDFLNKVLKKEIKS